MKTIDMVCIGCPLGCNLSASIDGDKIIVKGNTCPNGEKYAKNEIINPTRIVTSTIKVIGGKGERVSCKTEKSIPKDKIFSCMKEIQKTHVKAPVFIGDVLIKDVCSTGINVVSTKTIEKEG